MWYETSYYAPACTEHVFCKLETGPQISRTRVITSFIKSREFNNGGKKPSALTNLIHLLSRYFSTANIISFKEKTALVIGRMNIKT